MQILTQLETIRTHAEWESMLKAPNITQKLKRIFLDYSVEKKKLREMRYDAWNF